MSLLKFKLFLCMCSTIIVVATIPVNAEFVGELLLRDVAKYYENSGQYDPGHTEFELLVDYSYRDDNGTVWTAPTGTVVNGASIPRTVWSSVGGPWSGKYRNAAVIHDYLTVEKPSSSDVVHRLFLDGMLDNGVAPFRAHLMYAAVVMFGGTWTEAGNFTANGEPVDMSEDDLKNLTSYLKNNKLNAEEIRSLKIDDIRK